MQKTKLFFVLFSLLCPFILMAQSGDIAGTVMKAETGEPLAMAQIVLVGTNMGSTTDLSGEYMLKNIPAGSYQIKVSYVGFKSVVERVVVAAGIVSTVDFEMVEDIISGEDITVIASRAKRRETPVAFTDLSKSEITEELGSRDIPMVLNSTPGVYATMQGGAAGDARINVRGFDQTNFAIMINGVPVNDMENGWVYWSNWDGLGDATSSVQVQRGMGASNLAISSVGGTVNIITDAASFSKSASFKQEVGNDGFLKSTINANTGLMNDKFAASATFVRKTGDGFADKTWTDAYAYFLGLSFLPHDKHKFDLFAVGAPQQHGQRSYKTSIKNFDMKYAYDLGVDTTGLTGNYGISYNPNWGPITGASAEDLTEYYYGEEHDPRSTDYLMERQNYYHKPQFNLNWYWQIAQRVKFSNVFYLSLGRGGGTGRAGSNPGTTVNGTIDWTNAYNNNTDETNIDSTYSSTLIPATTILRNSVNQHNWYGWIGTFDFDLNDNFDLKVGGDVRSYKGEHWYEVRNLIGADYYIATDNDNINYTTNPSAAMLGLGDKFSFYYDGWTRWLGGFATLEYKKNKFAGFANVAVSNTSYKSKNYFVEGEPEDDWQDFSGYAFKGGLNYNINDFWNIYGNAGHMNKPPNTDGVYVNNRYSNDKFDDPENEKILSGDLGIGFSNKAHTVYLDANYYYTKWEDKTWNTTTYVEAVDSTYAYSLQGIDALHHGLELTATARPNKWLQLSAMASIGNWSWLNDVSGTFVAEEAPDTVYTTDVYLEDIKVGDAPQTTLALTATVFPIEGAYATVVLTRYDDHYTAFDTDARSDPSAAGVQPWKIPAYELVDLHLGYTIPDNIPSVDFRVFAHVFNIFDIEYISDSEENQYGANNYDAATAQVFIGPPRTWNIGFQVDL